MLRIGNLAQVFSRVTEQRNVNVLKNFKCLLTSKPSSLASNLNNTPETVIEAGISRDQSTLTTSQVFAYDASFHHFESTMAKPSFSPVAKMPAYMQRVYWWAYLQPWSPKVFDHPIVVNAILWGNYVRLREAALKEFPVSVSSDPRAPVNNALQIACAYGSVSPTLFSRMNSHSRLEIIDISTVQLDIVARKISVENTLSATQVKVVTDQPSDSVSDTQSRLFIEQDFAVAGSNKSKKLVLRQGNATDLSCYQTGEFGFLLSFFLLHEVPEDVRKDVVAEMFRVAAPGSKLVFIDYHRPSNLNPVKPIMMLVNKFLEPFADDLWEQEIHTWIPQDQTSRIKCSTKQTYFGGLYQKVVFELF